MKVSAIICEYNPLHNGHVYHLDQTRRAGATHIVGVMSGSFMQRGDVALLDKFDRATLALRGGMDLVIELPCVHALSSAETYARAAVSLLDSLGVVDELSFGSTCGDMEALELLAQASLTTRMTYSDKIRSMMREGISYPQALSRAVEARYGVPTAMMMKDPNNILAIEYLAAIQTQGVNIKPLNVTRKYVVHDSVLTKGNLASASYVRKNFLDGDDAYQNFVPGITRELIASRKKQGGIAEFAKLESILLYRMRMMTDVELANLPDSTPALVHRMKNARNARSLVQLLEMIKDKSTTMARIRRMVLCAAIGIEASDTRTLPPYARILALNERGRELLRTAKHTCRIPASTSLATLQRTNATTARFAELEGRATSLYGLAKDSTGALEDEYRVQIGLEYGN